MGTPFKEDILKRAKEKDLERKVRLGLPALTAEEEELKESGDFYEAQRDLMGADSEMKAQQESYLRDMAKELRFELVSRKEHKQFVKWQMTPEPPKPKPRTLKGIWTGKPFGFKPPKLPLIDVTKKKRAKTFKQAPTPKALEVILGVPKKAKPKRKKSHVHRNGKTMRKLRHVKGVKVFSFPDDIWKVRKRGKRR